MLFQMSVSCASDPVLCLNPMARYKFDTSLSQIEDNYMELINDNFTSYLLKRGRLFKSTGLRNLQYSNASLKHISSTLLNDINRYESENCSTVSYNVEIKPLDSELQHPCPLKVCVNRLDSVGPEIITTVVYVGVFYSWRMVDIRPCREFLNLPFLFSAGAQKFVTLMNSLFEKYFGCKISPVVFTQHDIKWLLAVLTQSIDAHLENDIHFVYQIATECLKVDVSFPFSSFKEIWNEIHDENESEIKYEEVVQIYAAFDEHSLESCGLDLSHFLLKRFTIPGYITVDSVGKIHIMERGILDVVFRFLKDKVIL